MYAALLADSAWLADEMATFQFLVVGLMDEQVREALVMPQRTVQRRASAFGAQVPWRDTRFDFPQPELA